MSRDVISRLTDSFSINFRKTGMNNECLVGCKKHSLISSANICIRFSHSVSYFLFVVFFLQSVAYNTSVDLVI